MFYLTAFLITIFKTTYMQFSVNVERNGKLKIRILRTFGIAA